MLKRKVNQAAYDALADNLKFEYKKAKDDEWVLDTDDAVDLINARDAEKREKEAFKVENDKLKKDLKAITDSNGNWETLEASYKTKIATLENDVATVNTTLTTERRDRHTATDASKIAGKFSVPSVIQPLIQKRLDIKTDASGKTTTVVLDNAGKPTALTLVDLEKEFVDNPEFKPMVIAHKGSGSAVGNLPAAPGKPADTTTNPTLISKMTPAQIVEHRKAAKAEAAGNAAAT